MIGGFFTSANTIDKKKTESLASSVFDRLQVERKVVRPAKRAIIRSIESSKILTAIKKHLSRLLGYPLKYYGVLLLTFGIFSLITFGARYYINSTADISHFTSAATLMFISLPLLLTSQCLNEALQGSVIAPFLLFKVVGLRQESLNECINTNPKNLVAFIFGALWSGVGITVSAFITDNYVASFSPYIIWFISCGILPDDLRTEVYLRGNYNFDGAAKSLAVAFIYFTTITVLLGIIFCKKAGKRCEE